MSLVKPSIFDNISSEKEILSGKTKVAVKVVDIFGNDQPIFPQAYPALYSVSLAFLTMWLVSKADSSDQATAYKESFCVMEDA